MSQEERGRAAGLCLFIWERKLSSGEFLRFFSQDVVTCLYAKVK